MSGASERASASSGRDPPESWYNQTPLPREAARLLWWGLSAKTRSGYSSAVKTYRVHCALNGLAPFAATLTSLASWIAELSTKRIQARTVKKYLTALRSSHVDMGYDGLAVFHHPQLQRMIAGMRRLRGEPDTKERCSITKDVLLRLLPLFNKATRGGMTMYAAFCLAFAGFLRVEDLT